MALSAVASAPEGVLKRLLEIFGKGGLLDTNLVERTEESELLGLAVVAGVDILFLGDPGTAKSQMLKLFTRYGLSGAKLYNHMVFKEAGVEELIGPRSIQGLKEDKIRRIVEGFLPEADTAVIDEIFKGSPAILNAMLDLYADRTLRVGGHEIDCSQLITIAMASNELPDREDLQPFRDRIAITKIVAPVRTPEGRERVSRIQIDRIMGQNGELETSVEPLTMEEVRQARDEAAAIPVPDAIVKMMGEAEQKWLEAGHPPSQRRKESMWKVIKAHAYLHAREEVSADDLLPCQHMAFNLLDHMDSARSIILEFASAFTRKGERLRQSLEPVLKSMDDLKVQLNAAQTDAEREDAIQVGMKLLGTLRGVGREAKKVIDEGQKQGQDTSVAEAVLAEVEAANKWAEDALIGEL